MGLLCLWQIWIRSGVTSPLSLAKDPSLSICIFPPVFSLCHKCYLRHYLSWLGVWNAWDVYINIVGKPGKKNLLRIWWARLYKATISVKCKTSLAFEDSYQSPGSRLSVLPWPSTWGLKNGFHKTIRRRYTQIDMTYWHIDTPEN